MQIGHSGILTFSHLSHHFYPGAFRGRSLAAGQVTYLVFPLKSAIAHYKRLNMTINLVLKNFSPILGDLGMNVFKGDR
jgi:hypothetical protein